jgi:hypothetical protein
MELICDPARYEWLKLEVPWNRGRVVLGPRRCCVQDGGRKMECAGLVSLPDTGDRQLMLGSLILPKQSHFSVASTHGYIREDGRKWQTNGAQFAAGLVACTDCTPTPYRRIAKHPSTATDLEGVLVGGPPVCCRRAALERPLRNSRQSSSLGLCLWTATLLD